MAVCSVLDLRIAAIPVQIREHPTFSPFQIRSDALRNTPQLFRLPLLRSPSLLLLDPGVELKMWIFRFHGFDVLIRRFAFALSQGRVEPLPSIGSRNLRKTDSGGGDRRVDQFALKANRRLPGLMWLRRLDPPAPAIPSRPAGIRKFRWVHLCGLRLLRRNLSRHRNGEVVYCLGSAASAKTPI